MANKIIKAQMKQRRDTKANWAAQNPVLLAGELGIVSDDPNLYKVGDGATAWNALPFRGFDGTLVHTTGDSETAAMSQKGVTEELAKLSKNLKWDSYYGIGDNLSYDENTLSSELVSNSDLFNRYVSVEITNFSDKDVALGCSCKNGYAQISFRIDNKNVIYVKPAIDSDNYTSDMFEDEFHEYRGYHMFFEYAVRVNWKKALENNVAISNEPCVKTVRRISQPPMYPFKGGKVIPLGIFKGFKDVFVKDRDSSKHYFISHCLTSTTHSTYQIRLAVSDSFDATSPSEYSVLISWIAAKSSIADTSVPITIEQNGHKIVVVLQELIETGVNWEYYNTVNPYSSAANVEFDWASIDLRSSFVEDPKIIEVNDKISKIQNSVNLLEGKIVQKDSFIGGSGIEVEENNEGKLAISLNEVDGNLVKDNSIPIDKLTPEAITKIRQGAAESIVNNPDEVTLTTYDNVLSIKNHKATFDTLGHYIIAKEIDLTQQMIKDWGASIIEVKAKVNIASYLSLNPQSVFVFNGGCFVWSDNTVKISPNGATIISPPYHIFKNCEIFTNHWRAKEVHPEWFGAKGDGVTYSKKAFTLCTYVDAPIKLSDNSTYLMEASLRYFSGTMLGGKGSTLKRSETFVDIPIVRDVTSASQISPGVVEVVVDTAHADYNKLFVGMATTIVNNPNNSRYVEGAYREIISINGEVVTLKGNTLDTTFAAGTVNLTNNYNILHLTGSAKIDGITIDGCRSSLPVDRVYWECSNNIAIYNGVNTVISNCAIVQAVAEGIIGGGNNVIVSNNSIEHCGGNGIHFSGSYDWKVVDNTFFDTNLNLLTRHNEGAITYSNNVANILIDGNVFDTCRNGIGSIDSADNCKSIIVNNTFINYRENGIQGVSVPSSYGNTFKDYVIANNRFYGTTAVASWEEKYQRNAYTERVDSSGYAIKLAGYNGGKWENVTVSNNSIINACINIDNCDNATFQGNTMTLDSNLRDSIIRCNGTNMAFVGNSIKTTVSVPLIDSDGNVIIANNVLKGDITLPDSSNIRLIENVIVA